MPYRTEAIILRRSRFGESSLVVTLFTRDRGRVDALAKGCRRPKSPMLGHLDLFNREEALLYERPRGGLAILAESAILGEVMALRTRPAAFAVAALAGEFLLHAFMPLDPHPGAYDLFAAGLSLLDRPGLDAPVACALLLGLVDEAGFRPQLDGCAVCGLPAEAAAERFTLRADAGGLVCPNCPVPLPEGTAAVRHHRLAPSALAVLRRLQRFGLAAAERVRFAPREAAEAVAALSLYAALQAGRPLRSAGHASRLLLVSGRARRIGAPRRQSAAEASVA